MIDYCDGGKQMVDIETVLQAHVQPMHDKEQLVSTL